MAQHVPSASGETAPGTVKETILAVATDLFIRHGYHGVSFLDIARELGIRHSHIHYYFGTKARLAEAALNFYAVQTLSEFRDIWAAGEGELVDRFSRSRDWIYRRYITYNPKGTGGQNWGLLSRFAGESEAMSPTMRKTLRLALAEMDGFIAEGIAQAIARGELSADAPTQDIASQIASLLYTSRHITRFEGSFQRLDDLLRWTFEVIRRAYGRAPSSVSWPPFEAAVSGE